MIIGVVLLRFETTSYASDLWNTKLNAEVCPWVKLFALRACREVLSTRFGFSRSLPNYDATNCICTSKCADESAFHAVPSCKMAQAIWFHNEFDHLKVQGCGYVADWWHNCFKKLVGKELNSFLTLCWSIWGARCRYVMENEHPDPAAIISYASKISSEVLEVCSSKQCDIALIMWFTPPAGSHRMKGGLRLTWMRSELGEVGSGIGVMRLS